MLCTNGMKAFELLHLGFRVPLKLLNTANNIIQETTLQKHKGIAFVMEI